MPRILNEREIADFLLEDIPSDGESVCSVEPDEDDNNDGSQSMMVLGDIPPELQPELDDGFTSDDDVPLSNLVLPSTSASHNQTEVVEPKWKRHYKMEEPSEYIGGGGVPTNIIDLENVSPTQLFRMFWSEDLVFFHFLDCAVVNAFLVYKEIQKEHHPQLGQLDTKNFRRSVYQGILAPAQAKNGKHSRRSLSGSGPSPPLPVLIKRHKPSVPTELRTESNMHQPERSTSRRCAKCSTKRSPARTVWQCSTCKVPLCIRKDKTCFVDFHKK